MYTIMNFRILFFSFFFFRIFLIILQFSFYFQIFCQDFLKHRHLMCKFNLITSLFSLVNGDKIIHLQNTRYHYSRIQWILKCTTSPLNNFDLLLQNKTASQSDIPPIRNKISNSFLIPSNLNLSIRIIRRLNSFLETGNVKINLKWYRWVAYQTKGVRGISKGRTMKRLTSQGKEAIKQSILSASSQRLPTICEKMWKDV